MPPAANAAGYDTRAGGSSPAETLPVISFDADTPQYMDYECRLVDYAGSGFNFNGCALFASATMGNARMSAAFRRLDTGEDIDGAHVYAYQSVNIAAPAVNGQFVYFTIPFTNAQIDGLVNGEDLIVRLKREADDVPNDTASGAFLVASVGIKEA